MVTTGSEGISTILGVDDLNGGHFGCSEGRCSRGLEAGVRLERIKDLMIYI
jgi:hypothetical protein